MAHYTEKREAKALLGQALKALGWVLCGWKDDKSDSMTDYYDPESWRGVATKAGHVVCVDVCSYEVRMSGKPETKRHHDVRGAQCENCAGSGDDPSGWTLEAARKEPRRYTDEMDAARNNGAVNIFNLSKGSPGHRAPPVSPIPFRSSGALSCRKCHGKGAAFTSREEVLYTWPTFQANPGRSSWHVETEGKIVAKGAGVFSTVTSHHNTPGGRAAAVAKLAAKIDKAAEPPKPRTRSIMDYTEHGSVKAALAANVAARDANVPEAAEAEKTPESAAGPCSLETGVFTVKPSVGGRFAEIRFGAKPSAAVRAELRAAHFRWSASGRYWFGSPENLPDRYHGRPAARLAETDPDAAEVEEAPQESAPAPPPANLGSALAAARERVTRPDAFDAAVPGFFDEPNCPKQAAQRPRRPGEALHPETWHVIEPQPTEAAVRATLECKAGGFAAAQLAAGAPLTIQNAAARDRATALERKADPRHLSPETIQDGTGVARADGLLDDGALSAELRDPLHGLSPATRRARLLYDANACARVVEGVPCPSQAEPRGSSFCTEHQALVPATAEELDAPPWHPHTKGEVFRMLGFVLRAAGMGDCTRGGITSRKTSIVCANDGDVRAELHIVPWFGYFKAVPAGVPGGVQTMMGGNFITSSDTRWQQRYPHPIPVHDRIER